MEKITKKHIQKVLRTEDPTQIFRIYVKATGEKADRAKVYEFIRAYAPTVRVFKAAYNLAYPSRSLPLALYEKDFAASVAYGKDNRRQLVMQHWRDEVRRGVDGYTKRPIMGHTWLYWASPVYGHDDYNKSRAIPIKGNERFCELICRLADKYIPTV